MRIRKRITGLATAAGLATALIIGAASAALAQPFPETVTTESGNTYALNNSGGNTGNGTAIIGWHPRSSNDGWYASQLTGYCGGGVVTSTCPFAVGSGLNSQYEGSPIVEMFGGQINKCAANEPGTTLVEVNGCGATGYVWIQHESGGVDFYINSYLSSLNWTQHGNYDDPSFLTNATPYGSQALVLERANGGGGAGSGWTQIDS